MDKIIIILPAGITSDRIYTMSEAGMISGILSLQGYNVKIIDSIEYINPCEEIKNIIKAEKPSFIIGIFMWSYLLTDQLYINIFKELEQLKINTHYTATGRIATLSYKTLFNIFNIFQTVVIGESEKTIPELFYRINYKLDYTDQKGIAYKKDKTVIVNEKQFPISDLDSLPFPDMSYLKNKGLYPIAPLNTSRYCYGKCSFCLNKMYQSAISEYEYRARSIDMVIKEIEEIIEKYKVNIFYFLDNNFFVDGKKGKIRAKEFAEKLIEKKINISYYIECRANDVEVEFFTLLKKSGLRKVLIGIESWNQTFLDRYSKETTVSQNDEAINILTKLGIKYEPGFIMFEPYTTLEDLKNNIHFIKKHKMYLQRPARFFNSIVFFNETMQKDLIYSQEVNDVNDNCTIPYSFKDQKVKQIYKNIAKIYFTLDKFNQTYNNYSYIINNIMQYIKNRNQDQKEKNNSLKILLNIVYQISKWFDNQAELNFHIFEKFVDYFEKNELQNIENEKITGIINKDIEDYHFKYYNKTYEENKNSIDKILIEYKEKK